MQQVLSNNTLKYIARQFDCTKLVSLPEQQNAYMPSFMLPFFAYRYCLGNVVCSMQQASYFTGVDMVLPVT